MKTYTKQEVEEMQSKLNKDTFSFSFAWKYLVILLLAIFLVGLYAVVLLNIFFAGVLNKGFILSIIALPFLVWFTIKLNKAYK